MTLIPPSISDELDAQAEQYRGLLGQSQANAAGAAQQAQMIAEYRLRAPGLPAGSYLSMAQSGLDPATLDAVQSQYVPSTDSNTVKTNNSAAGVAKPKPKPKGGGGLFGAIGGVLGDAGHALGWVGSHTEHAVLGNSVSSAIGDEVVKPAVRFGSAALASGFEATQNMAFQAPEKLLGATPIGAIANAPGISGAVRSGLQKIESFGPSPYKPGTDSNPADAFKATTLGQMFATGDTGTGFLPPQTATAAAAKLQRAVRGTVGGHAATAGRVFAGHFVHADTQPFNIMSGAVDFYMAKKLDPVNALNDSWRAARVAHQTFTTGDELANAGAFNGFRKMFQPQTAQEWLDGPKGALFAGGMTKLTSAAEVRQAMRGQGTAELWRALASAETPEAVRSVMTDAVSDGLRDVPKVGATFRSTVGGYGIVKPFRDWRVSGMVPEHGFDPNGPGEDAVKFFDDSARNAKIPSAVRQSIVNDAIDAAANPDIEGRKAGYFATMRRYTQAVQQSIAGEDWFNGQDAKNLAASVVAGARPETTADIEAALSHAFPGRTFSSEFVDSLAHTALGTATQEDRTKRFLSILADTHPDASATDLTDEHAQGFQDLMQRGTTQANVRDWLGSAFPNESPDDSTIRRLARAAGDTQSDRQARVLDMIRGEVPMGRAHLPVQSAQEITRWSRNETAESRQFWINAGAPDSTPTIMLDNGEAAPITGPHLASEFLNRFVEGPDYKTIKRSTSMFANLLQASPDNERPYFSLLTHDDGHQRLLMNILDKASTGWKTLAVARPALMLRVLAGQQVQMGLDGLDSVGNHPLKMIGHILAGHNGMATDINGEEFLNELDQTRSGMRGALGTNSSGYANWDREASARYGRVAATDRNFIPSWGGEISQLSADPIARSVAAAMENPVFEGPDGPASALEQVKDEFWSGIHSSKRQAMLDSLDPANPDWRQVVASRAGADRYIDTYVDRIAEKSVDDKDLIHAVATGELDGKYIADGKSLAPHFKAKLDDLHAEGVHPSLVKGKLATGNYDPKSYGQMLDRAEQKFWHTMVDIPSSKITKVPLGMQLYSQEVARHMGPGYDWRNVLDAVEKGDTTSIRAELAHGPSELTAAEVDALAKTHVLNTLARYTHQGVQRSQLTDTFRTLIPFGDIFRQETKRWATLAADNLPTALRRSTQGIQEGRDSGFIFTNPTTGEESVHIPLPGIVQSAVSSVPGLGTAVDPGASFSAPISGFNIVGQGLPGFGAVVALPMDQVLKHLPGGDELRATLEPYGPPDLSGGILEAFLPSWAKKIFSGFKQDEHDRTYASVLADATIAKWTQNPDKYPNTPDGMNQLHEDAAAAAKQMLLIRAAAQSVLPSAPSIDQKVKINNHWVELAGITKDWTKIESDTFKNGGNMADATAEFLNRYGDTPAVAMIPQTVPLVYGLSASQSMVDFRRANPSFVRNFKDVWPLFAPGPGAVDANGDTQGTSYNNYLTQLSDGDRQTVSWDQRIALRDYRIGSMLYDKARTQVGLHPTADQRLWLSAVKDKIGESYPGYAANGGQYPQGIGTKAPIQNAIAQLAKAAENPTVANTPLAEGVRLYTLAREKAIESLGTHSSTPFKSQQASGARLWLQGIASQLAKSYQGFGTVYDYVYSREVEDPNSDTQVSAADAVAADATAGG